MIKKDKTIQEYHQITVLGLGMCIVSRKVFRHLDFFHVKKCFTKIWEFKFQNCILDNFALITFKNFFLPIKYILTKTIFQNNEWLFYRFGFNIFCQNKNIAQCFKS